MIHNAIDGFLFGTLFVYVYLMATREIETRWWVIGLQKRIEALEKAKEPKK